MSIFDEIYTDPIIYKFIKFQDLLTHPIIIEAISLKNVRKKNLTKKSSGAYNEELDEIFNNKNRLISRITIDYSNIDSPLMKKIDALLDDEGYTVGDMESYIKGFAYKQTNLDNYSTTNNLLYDKKNPVKIGKLLQRYEADGQIEVTDRKDGKKTTKWITGKPLLHEFKNDPIRSSNGEFLVVISRHPYDIAGASTDRSWTSCMDLGLPRINYPKTRPNEGINRKYIPRDIEEGTLVAYVVPKNELFIGPNGEEKVKLQKPLSRIFMKPHKSDAGPVYTIGSRYGAPYPEFHKQIEEWISKTLNNKLKGGEKIYKNTKLYNDNDTPVGFKFNSGNEIADEVVTEKLSWTNEKELGNQITFQTSNDGGGYYEFKVNVNIDFGKDIVKPFDDLDEIREWDVKNISSKIERNIASSIFKQLVGSSVLPLKMTATSTGDGIDIELEFGFRIFSDTDKYVDNDIIYDGLDINLDWLKEFDYQELKRDLYKICSTYDWGKDESDKKNYTDALIESYKQLLNITLNSLNASKLAMSNFKIEPPKKIVESGEDNASLYLEKIKSAKGGLNAINHQITILDQTIPYKIRNSEYYTESKYNIMREWFNTNFKTDLVEVKKNITNQWRLVTITDARTSDFSYEILRSMYYEMLDIQKLITKLIGYIGEVKI